MQPIFESKSSNRSMGLNRLISAFLAIGLVLYSGKACARSDDKHDYKHALRLSFYFLEAQRSGYLPTNQRVKWRSDSALTDGYEQEVDLVGGYYDAGDNVKFQLPMAFTVTILSWSVIEYAAQLSKLHQLRHALDAIKWGTDYFIKAHSSSDVLWVEVGDGYSDHQCWQRPEDMTTSRKAYKVDTQNPGSEVAAETAAAMAAASIVFQQVDRQYSATLLFRAKQLFRFADAHRGSYSDSVPIARRFYGSGPSKYEDELLWAAFWLFWATDDQFYLHYAVKNARTLGGTEWAVTEFGWDMKFAGVQVLASKVLLERREGNNSSVLQAYKNKAEHLMCSCLNRSGVISHRRTPGGLLWFQSWNNLQFVTSASFLLVVYGDLLARANQKLICGGTVIPTSEIEKFVKSQVDYILGTNPMNMSYMVGFGSKYPRFVHHRGASIISLKKDNRSVGCFEGYKVWYRSMQPDPNQLTGAIVGGPFMNDSYVDRRDNWDGGEACTYNNAFIVGLLARVEKK
ncbi:hypothetical protein R1sor_027115 [Riccia sorocarpa]|uniref:Endoglucanase n=1 Tax=Riccia sorocarpa TaxID=122646 RepID=A0ABD3GG75_9MARC